MVKKLQTLLILTLVPVASFASAKAIRAFVDTDLLIVMKMAVKSNTHTPNFVASSQDFQVILLLVSKREISGGNGRTRASCSKRDSWSR